MGYKSLILKSALVLVGFVVVINLIILDFNYFQKKEPVVQEAPAPAATETLETSLPFPSSLPISASSGCTTSCKDEISKAIATLSALPIKTSPPAVTTKRTFEAYIPVGSGQTANSDWTDIPGAGVYIDMSKYGTVKEVYFEAQLRLPTGNGQVCARLVNKNENVPLSMSEVCSGASKGQLIISPKINLSYGNKLYGVEMKVSMPPYEGILDLGRIKLIYE